MSYKRLDNLEGKVAVIAGCVGDIGFATAKRLAESGATVIGIDRRSVEECQTIIDTLPNRDRLKHTAFHSDIQDSNTLNQIAKQIELDFGRCDILINTVGYTESIPHEDVRVLTDEIFDKILTVNLRGAFSLIRAFTELMKNTDEGLIVNVSSAAAIRIGGSNLAYAAAKAGVDSLTRNLSKALGPKIRVVSVSPSALDTKFVPNRSGNFLASIAKSTPLGRIATVDDIACTIEALATVMRFNTGNTIFVDGGRSV